MMFQLLLGHLAGDYLFQNEWMAQHKSENNLFGWFTALIHCIIYTLTVALFMWNFTWQWMLIVFLSHFPIDKFGLAEYYLTFIKGRSLRKYIKETSAPNSRDILNGGFGAVVYTITDNAMHLILMWIGYNFLYVW